VRGATASAERDTPRKLVWRAEIVLATADGCGTSEIMRRSTTSKPTVWNWRERYLDEDMEILRRDKARASRVSPPPREMCLKVIAKPPRMSSSGMTRAGLIRKNFEETGSKHQIRNTFFHPISNNNHASLNNIGKFRSFE
jgi:hypothetical protein